MAKYALLRGGRVVDIRDMDSADELAHKTDDERDGGDGGPFVRPVSDAGMPDFNPMIETLSTSHRISAKAVEIVYVVEPRDIGEVKNELCCIIDQDAERERLKYITPGDGQALEYAYVVNEAMAFQADPNGDFPLLQASVSAGEAKSTGDAAEIVLKKNADWLMIGARIRETRLKAKRNIEASSGVKEAFSAFQAVRWDG